jgi:hypothetical protein
MRTAATPLDKARAGKRWISLSKQLRASLKTQAGLSDSLSAIERAHDLPALDARVEAAKSDPAVMRHVANWKQHVEPEATEWYNELKGSTRLPRNRPAADTWARA